MCSDSPLSTVAFLGAGNSSEWTDDPNVSLKCMKFTFMFTDCRECLQLLSEQPVQSLLLWPAVRVLCGTLPLHRLFLPSVPQLEIPAHVHNPVSPGAVAAIKCSNAPVSVKASCSCSVSDLSFMQVSYSCLKENYAAYRTREKNQGLNIPLESCPSLFPEGSRLLLLLHKALSDTIRRSLHKITSELLFANWEKELMLSCGNYQALLQSQDIPRCQKLTL